MNPSQDRLQYLLQAFDPSLPLERARTIPSSWYTDPALYAAERMNVFSGGWVAVGRVDQVAEPGMFFTAEARHGADPGRARSDRRLAGLF